MTASSWTFPVAGLRSCISTGCRFSDVDGLKKWYAHFMRALYFVCFLIMAGCSYTTRVYEESQVSHTPTSLDAHVFGYKVKNDVLNEDDGDDPEVRGFGFEASVLTESEFTTLSHHMREITMIRGFDLKRTYASSQLETSHCKTTNLRPEYFRRPRGGGHAGIYDPSLILGFAFEPAFCVDEGSTELCVLIKRRFDSQQPSRAVPFYLTPETEPFRAYFQRIFDDVNKILEKRVEGIGYLSLEKESVRFQVDCTKQFIAFTDNVFIDDRHFKAYTLLTQDTSEGVIYDADVFIDAKELAAFTEPRAWWNAFRRRVLHEIGHSYGMVDNHSLRTDSVMSIRRTEDPNVPIENFTPFDISTLRFIYSSKKKASLFWYTRGGKRYLWDFERDA